MRATPEKLRETLGDGIWWAPLYELSLAEGLPLLIYVLGKTERVKETSQLPDPQEVVLREAEEGPNLNWVEDRERVYERSSRGKGSQTTVS